MLLSEFMRREGLTDSDVGNAVGLSAEAIRKLRFRTRGPSSRVSAALFQLSGGAVRPPDLVTARRDPDPVKRREARVG